VRKCGRVSSGGIESEVLRRCKSVVQLFGLGLLLVMGCNGGGGSAASGANPFRAQFACVLEQLQELDYGLWSRLCRHQFGGEQFRAVSRWSLCALLLFGTEFQRSSNSVTWALPLNATSMALCAERHRAVPAPARNVPAAEIMRHLIVATAAARLRRGAPRFALAASRPPFRL
jgi:hypothetical protein